VPHSLIVVHVRRYKSQWYNELALELFLLRLSVTPSLSTFCVVD